MDVATKSSETVIKLREEIVEINKRKTEDENDFVKAINQVDDNNRLLREEIERLNNQYNKLEYEHSNQSDSFKINKRYVKTLEIELSNADKEIERLKERNGKYTTEDMGLLWQYIVDKAKQIVIGAEITNNLNFDEYINQLNDKL